MLPGWVISIHGCELYLITATVIWMSALFSTLKTSNDHNNYTSPLILSLFLSQLSKMAKFSRLKLPTQTKIHK